MSVATEKARDAMGWAGVAIRALQDAQNNLSQIAFEVARDLARGDDERFVGARLSADTAWEQVTGKALNAIAAARAALVDAERSAREAEASHEEEVNALGQGEGQ
jgi:hypothetical protein